MRKSCFLFLGLWMFAVTLSAQMDSVRFVPIDSLHSPPSAWNFSDTPVEVFITQQVYNQPAHCGGGLTITNGDTVPSPPVMLISPACAGYGGMGDAGFKRSADLINVTIVSNATIQVDWAIPDGLDLTKLTLERLSAGSAWTPLATLPVSDVTYTDATVSVEDSTYAYRLVCEDLTGEVTTSNEGQSILLTASRSNTGVDLSWNTYYQWRTGVDHFELETRKEGAATWQKVADLSASTLTYRDATPHPDGGIWCWRIRAFELEGYQSSSLSNEACTPVDLIIPNTFTPNSDGINDYWLVEGLELYPGCAVTVYNRWGQVVMESSNPALMWDGKDIRTHIDLPDGAYYYTLTIPGREKMFRGYIMLLR